MARFVNKQTFAFIKNIAHKKMQNKHNNKIRVTIFANFFIIT